MGLKKYRNKEGIKYKKTILLQKSGGKKRLEDFSTSVRKIKSGNRSRVVQSFSSTTLLQLDSLLVFSFLRCFCTFFQAHPYLHFIFTEIIYPWFKSFFCLLGSKILKRYRSTSSAW